MATNSGRRLPSWMISGASSGVTTTSNLADNKQEAEVPKTKVERKPRRTVKPKETNDVSEETKKVGIKKRGRERVCNKNEEEEAKPSIDDGKDPEIIESVISLKDEDFTVDDLLSFAQEYVKGEEVQEKERSSVSESIEVPDESITRSSQGEPNAEDMLSLLLGPFFKKA